MRLCGYRFGHAAVSVERRLIAVAKKYLFTMSSGSVSVFSRVRFWCTHFSPTLSIVIPSSELSNLASVPNGLFDKVIVVESTDLGNLSRICATIINHGILNTFQLTGFPTGDNREVNRSEGDTSSLNWPSLLSKRRSIFFCGIIPNVDQRWLLVA